MRKIAVLLTLGFLLNLNNSFSQRLLHPYNLDFEEGASGSLPVGWVIPGHAVKNNYTAVVSIENPIQGNKCVQLRYIELYKEGLNGAVMQTLDAKNYRGKTIRFRAAARAEIMGPKGSAHLWITVRLPDECEGNINTSDEHPIVTNEWKYYEVQCKIDENADLVNFGLMLIGSGFAYMDDASIEIVDETGGANEPPKELTPAACENLAAFANIFGDVRFFYPGFEVRSIDWDWFALTGVEAVENAKSKEEFLDVLKNMFLPVAPGILIYPTNKKSKENLSFTPPANSLKNIALAWKHVGAPVAHEVEIMKSELVNIYRSQRENEGVIVQVVNAEEFRGHRIRFSAYAKADVYPPASNAQLWIQVDLTNNKLYSYVRMDDKPIKKNTWEQYSIETDIPQDALTIKIGLALIGDGKAWFDDAKIATVKDGKEVFEFVPRNAGFEDSDTGKIVRSWYVPLHVENAGYSGVVTTEAQHGGKQSLCLFTDENTRVNLPQVGDFFEKDLPGGVSYKFALTNYIDSMQTLPYPPKNNKKLITTKPDNFLISGDDRTSRLAIVVIAWNVLKQFCIDNMPNEQWNKLLKEALTKAAADKNKNEFLTTLKRMLVQTPDYQARVWQPPKKNAYGFPLLLRWINGQVVITKVVSDNLNISPGDIVTAIDKIPIVKLLEEREKLINGSPKWKRLSSIADIRAGEKDSKAVLNVKKTSGETVDITISRTLLLSEFIEDRPPALAEVSPGIIYTDLTRMTDDAYRYVAKNYENAQGLIFDARGFSPMTDFFLGMFAANDKKSVSWLIPIFTKPEHWLLSNKILAKDITAKDPYLKCKVVFLADERSFGNIETILALAKYYKLAEIVGSETSGQIEQVEGCSFPGDYYMSMTVAKCIFPDGKRLSNTPVQPTIEVNPTIQGIIENKDELIEKAIEILTK